jgi:hypothetical protein
VTRYLQRKGRRPREGDVDDEASGSEPELLAWIAPHPSRTAPGSVRERAAANAVQAECAAANGGAPECRSDSQRSTWAELLLRVFSIDVLECPHCGARPQWIALITEGVVVRKILDHLGLPSEPPGLARARVGEELDFGE